MTEGTDMNQIEKVARAIYGADRDGVRYDADTYEPMAKAAIAAMPVQAEPVATRWQLGDKVCKKRGSSWRGTVCGFYSTPHTPQGYCVDSAFEPGSVQVWPKAALEDWEGGSDAE